VRIFSGNRQLPQAAICVFVFCVVAGLYFLEQHGYAGNVLTSWDHRFRDMVTATGRFTPPDQRLVFVGIDSTSVSISDLDLNTLYADVDPASVESRALHLVAAGWPWSREVYSLLADRLLQAGARGVVFDLLLLKSGTGDEALQKSIRRANGRIIIGANFVEEVTGPGASAWSLNLPPSSVVADASPQNPAIGYVNFWPGFGGIVRGAHYATTLDQLQGGKPPEDIGAETPVSIAARAAALLGASLPSDPFALHLIRFSGPPRTFGMIPAFQIFVPNYWKQNLGEGSVFRDKIVFVGPYGNWAHDEHATPFGAMQGAELHLNSLNALLHRTFIREFPAWTYLFFMAFAAVAAWLLAVFARRITLRLLGFLLSLVLFLGIVKLAYDHAGRVLPAIPPLLTFGVAGLSCFAFDYTRERLERLRVRRTLEAYVSEVVVRDILDNPQSYLNALGGKRTPVALLMTDLRGFTAISEQMDSTELVTQLNEYLSVMVDDIFAVRGSVDKFVGDAVFAVWGHLNSSGAAQDTALAVEAGLKMQKSLGRLNEQWKQRGLRTFKMGCAINFGEVVFGNIGSSRKMEPTVIGDAVNVTARLEGLTKDYGRDLLIGEAAADLVRDSFPLQFVDRVILQGRTQPLAIYCLLDAANVPFSGGTAYLAAYERAQGAYRAAEFAQAVAEFRECLEHWPEDKLAAVYLDRCAYFLDYPPTEEWNAVHVASHK
jgi:adenylate cyclase